MAKKQYVQVKIFFSQSKEDESFIIVKSKQGISFKDQIKMIEHEYYNVLKTYDIDEDSVVFRKFFLSDIVNQIDEIKQSRLYGEPNNDVKVAVSTIQQTPLDSVRITMFAYHVSSKKSIQKLAPNKQYLMLKRSDVHQLWSTNLAIDTRKSNYPKSPNEQTRIIFEQITNQLAKYNATLEENTIRTWLFVRDIDRHYQGMVDQRRDFFYQQGMTPDTHFIASTGIGGERENPNILVSLDALSLLGVKKEQISYLKAPDYLSDTSRYNVTFERGVKISYNDREHLHISGTASIDKFGKVVYEKDVILQTARTLENMDQLLHSGNATLRDLMYVIVYLRDPSDIGPIESYLTGVLGGVPYVIVHAPICRPKWLVEIEGLAIKRKIKKNLPNF